MRFKLQHTLKVNSVFEQISYISYDIYILYIGGEKVDRVSIIVSLNKF